MRSPNESLNWRRSPSTEPRGITILLLKSSQWRNSKTSRVGYWKSMKKVIQGEMCAKSLQSCLTLCDPVDCSPPGSLHGVLQARILEWVAISFSRGSSRPSDQIYHFSFFLMSANYRSQKVLRNRGCCQAQREP